MAKKLRNYRTQRVITGIDNNVLPEYTIAQVNYDLLKEFMPINREKLRKSARQKWKIMHSGDLDDSFTTQIKKAGDNQVTGMTKFNFYGRFVDMGVGRGQSLIEVQTGRALTSGRSTQSKRKPKPWLSDTMAAERHKLAELAAERHAEALAEYTAANLDAGKIPLSV